MWDHKFEAKFHGESNGDSFDALKRCFDSKMDLMKALLGSKIEKFRIWAERKVRPPIRGKMVHKGLIEAKNRKFTIHTGKKVGPSSCSKI